MDGKKEENRSLRIGFLLIFLVKEWGMIKSYKRIIRIGLKKVVEIK